MGHYVDPNVSSNESDLELIQNVNMVREMIP